MGNKPIYCREVLNLAEEFDPRSFRVKTITDKEGNIKAKLIIGCPLGHWDNVRKECCYKRDPITGKCIVSGTRGVSLLHFYEKGICPPGVYAIINRKYTGGKIVPFTKEDFLKYRNEYMKRYKERVKKLIVEKEGFKQKEVANLEGAIYNILK